MSDVGQTLLSVRDLVVRYPGTPAAAPAAVGGVSLDVAPGETVGLVGESGSGKSTIGGAILGLAPVTSGHVYFEGSEITHAPARTRRELSSKLQVIFQDPYGSLNPSRTIEQILVEPLLVRSSPLSRDARHERVISVLRTVGLDAADATRFPGHFSGGQRQRVAIARAVIDSPRLVVADEAVSALDLSIQAQVLNLMLSLQAELGIGYLFISHDLSVVRHMCDRILVLYRGEIMEVGEARTVSATPGHPYTAALLAAAPIPEPAAQRRARERNAFPLAPRSPGATTSHCPFANRCPLTQDVCTTTTPDLRIGPTGSLTACHFPQEAAALKHVATASTQPGGAHS